ncbi:malectin-A isoform X1 [Anopheles ziemanni]|uniref:malectin-A isoform X1 n=2 Tax=Anopheles coustani TaxID=139045 RepID=UPI0026595544|nr:malectin-A isoform X1 [Anopheles coustani]XP_058167821.1 malectin-A isoform X1 [Anopheles ziemanni]
MATLYHIIFCLRKLPITKDSSYRMDTVLQTVGVICIALFSISFGYGTETKHNIIYAINAGGEAHSDSHGIHYARDPLMGKVGTESDYGRQLLVINRVMPNDEILYQTERYHHDTFGYELPLAGDGDYVLILKFCEVYFNGPNMKVFDVLLNRHTVLPDLDIYALVGRGTAHDEYVYFSVSRGRMYFKGDSSEIRGGKVKLEFLKGFKDNPKINAIVLIKDFDEASLPRLGPMNNNNVAKPHTSVHGESFDGSLPVNNHNGQLNEWGNEVLLDDILSESSEETTKSSSKQRKTSGPKQPNPYSLDESSMMLPVFIAIGAFIPLLFCLCKL